MSFLDKEYVFFNKEYVFFKSNQNRINTTFLHPKRINDINELKYIYMDMASQKSNL